MLALVEQLARDQAALGPPFVEIVLLRRAARRRLQQPRGLDRPCRRGAATAPCGRCSRHRGARRSGTASSSAPALEALSDHGLARLADQQIVAAEQLRHAHAGIRIVVIEAAIHARLVVGAREHVAERLHHGALDSRRAGVLAPGLRARAARRRRDRLAPSSARASANLPFAVIGFVRAKNARTVAASRLSSHSALSARRRSIVAFGQLGLSATEGGEAVEARVVLVAAQDRPLDELARERIADGLLDAWSPRSVLPRRTRSTACFTSATSAAGVAALSVAASGAARKRSRARRRRRGGSAGAMPVRRRGFNVAAAAGVIGEKLVVGRIAAGESAPCAGAIGTAEATAIAGARAAAAAGFAASRGFGADFAAGFAAFLARGLGGRLAALAASVLAAAGFVQRAWRRLRLLGGLGAAQARPSARTPAPRSHIPRQRRVSCA